MAGEAPTLRRGRLDKSSRGHVYRSERASRQMADHPYWPGVRLCPRSASCSGRRHHRSLRNADHAAVGPRWPGSRGGEVAILYHGSTFLRDALAERNPADALVLTFGPPSSQYIPFAGDLLDVVDLPAAFATGTIAKVVYQDDFTMRVAVFDAGSMEDDLHYVTALSSVEEAAINPLQVLSSPAARRRRAGSAASVAAVEPRALAGGAPAACSPRPGGISSVLAAPQTSSLAKRKAAAQNAPAKGSRAGGAQDKNAQPTLRDVMEAVSGLAQRLTSLESAAQPSASGPPPPSCPTSSILAPGRFQQPTVPVSIPCAAMAQPSGLRGAMPPPPTRVAEAHRVVSALPVPPPGPEVERTSRARVADSTLREAVERGGADAQTAVQLAMLQAIQQMSKQRGGRRRLRRPCRGRRLRRDHHPGDIWNKGHCCTSSTSSQHRKESTCVVWQVRPQHVQCSWMQPHRASLECGKILQRTRSLRAPRRVGASRSPALLLTCAAQNPAIRFVRCSNWPVPQGCGANGASQRFMESLMATYWLARAPCEWCAESGPCERVRTSSKCTICQGHEGDRRSSQKRDRRWRSRLWQRRLILSSLGAGLACKHQFQFSTCSSRRWGWQGGTGPGTIKVTVHEATSQLLDRLKSWRIQRNFNRDNVASSEHGRSSCVILGAYTVQGAGVTKATYRALEAGILESVMAVLSTRRHQVPFSSIAITEDSQAPPHRDKNNAGWSSLLTFGNFRGGELLVEDPGGRKYIQVTPTVRCKARVAHSRSDWTYFDATRWHAVLPFTGHRYALAAYCCRGLHRLSEKERVFLTECGFLLPEILSEADDPN
eukprot:6462399-Amphidinium_carterae.1